MTLISFIHIFIVCSMFNIHISKCNSDDSFELLILYFFDDNSVECESTVNYVDRNIKMDGSIRYWKMLGNPTRMTYYNDKFCDEEGNDILHNVYIPNCFPLNDDNKLVMTEIIAKNSIQEFERYKGFIKLMKEMDSMALNRTLSEMKQHYREDQILYHIKYSLNPKKNESSRRYQLRTKSSFRICVINIDYFDDSRKIELLQFIEMKHGDITWYNRLRSSKPLRQEDWLNYFLRMAKSERVGLADQDIKQIYHDFNNNDFERLNNPEYKPDKIEEKYVQIITLCPLPAENNTGYHNELYGQILINNINNYQT